ncbi:nucleoside diphosphate kinase 6 isoform X1 [Opisthocomus hoazin]|uniref:nucleoside diphosphate kinase 6 isoform X1 n=1 Tax=Opisthocomus hoazin TaxID=30419 RepID=UPI003F52FE3B
MAVVGRCRPLQLTLALLKPDAVAHPLVLEVRPCTKPSSATGSSSCAPRSCAAGGRRAAASTGSTQGGSSTSGWWNSWPGTCRARGRAARGARSSLASLCSGPMWAYILAHENAVPFWRSLMGPTKVFQARNSVPDSIRGAYGLTDTRNTTHGSDSPASASREIAFFFPEFNEHLWYQQEEPRLRCGQVQIRRICGIFLHFCNAAFIFTSGI